MVEKLAAIVDRKGWRKDGKRSRDVDGTINSGDAESK